MALPMALSAQTAAPPPAAPASGGPVSRLMLAVRLFQIGLDRGDPLALAQAARLVSGLQRDAAAPAPFATRKAVPGPPRAPFDALAIYDILDGRVPLAGAQVMAEEDPLMREVLEGLAENRHAPLRGRIHLSRHAIAPGEGQDMTLIFAGGSLAEIALLADGTTQLTWAFSDGGEAPLCAEMQEGVGWHCRFTPAQNGFYHLRVDNHGPTPAAYLVVRN